MTIRFYGDYIPAQYIEIAQEKNCIGNFECAFSETAINSGKAYNSVLSHVSLEKNQKSIASFTALNLANNHVYDAGNFMETYFLLKNKFPSVQFFGIKEKPFAELFCGNLKIAIIGCLEQCRSRGPALFQEEQVIPLISQIKKDFQRIYIYPHWGKESEYTRYPSPRQIKLAHQWIAAGADGVLGHHSHVYHGKEIYQEKPVYYSLGNFFFPHQESALYDGTHTGLTLDIDPETNTVTEHFHAFDEAGVKSINQIPEKEVLNRISLLLPKMNKWVWAKKIGAFYLRKNMASWNIRIRKNPITNLPKFLLWCILPQTILFFVASIGNNNDDKTN